MNTGKIIGWVIFFTLLALIITFVPFSKGKVIGCKKDFDCAVIEAGCCKTPETINSRYLWIAKAKDFITTRGCGKVACEHSVSIEKAEASCEDKVCNLKFKR